MKILMIHPHDLFYIREPWTTRIKKLAEELYYRGHQVRLIHYCAKDGHHRSVLRDDLPIEVMEFQRGFKEWLKIFRIFNSWVMWADVVHLQKCMAYSTLPLLWSLSRNPRPFHYDWDDWEVAIFRLENGAEAPSWLKSLETNLPSFADTVSVASQQLRQLTLAAGVPADCIFDAPVGADIQLFHPGAEGAKSIRERYDRGNGLVIYMGQLHATQYADLFIKAALTLKKTHPDTIFLIVGDGWRRKQLQTLATSLKLDDTVIFTGGVRHEEVPAYLAASDIGVVCFEDNDAVRAKSPLKIAEYMASGLPIVASDVGDVPRMLGGAGEMVPAGDSHAMAEAISRLLSDSDLRKRYSLLGRERAEKIYNWKSISGNLEKAYQKTIG